MIGFTPTLRRELGSIWLTPRAWTLLICLLILQGTALSSIIASFAEGAERAVEIGPLEAFYGHSALTPLVYIFICPALTMHSFAEERRSGTIENLLSAPVSVSGIVLGKYVACLATFMLLWLPSIAYPLILAQVTEIDWRVVSASYLGICGLGAGLLAIGVLFSALTRSLFLAMILTGGAVLILSLLGIVEPVLSDGSFRQLCDYMAIQPQLAEVSQGIVSLRRLVYDTTIVVYPLFVCTRIVGSWRWS